MPYLPKEPDVVRGVRHEVVTRVRWEKGVAPVTWSFASRSGAANLAAARKVAVRTVRRAGDDEVAGRAEDAEPAKE